MAPYPDDGPTCTAKRVVSLAITLHIPGQFWRPVPIVDLWRPAVLGAAMPEAAVHKYRHALAREDDVRLDSSAMDDDPMILPKAIPQAVESRAQSDLGFRIGAADRLHVPGSAFGRRGRVDPRLPCPSPSLGAPVRVRHADGLRSQMLRSVTGSWQHAFEPLFEGGCGHTTTVGELRD